MIRSSGRMWILFLAVGILAALPSCGSDGGNGPDNPPDYLCNSEADSILTLANAELEGVLYEQLNRTDEIEHPSEVDFRAAQDLYQEALSVDADCPTAHFGAAITELITLSVDPAVTGAFDDWKEYLDANIPFEAVGSGKRPLGIPVMVSSGKGALNIPFEVVPLSLLAIARASMKAPTDGVPRIGEVQDLLEDTVLPRVDQAVLHLNFVAADTAFSFRVSGRMQGDEEEDPTYIDRTDILALRSGCHLLAAAINVAVAYNLELAAYDSATLYQELQPGSGWFTLKSGGAAKMEAAYDRMLDATDDLDATIVSLLDEGDPQYDDIIRIGPDDRSSNWDLDDQDVDSIRYNLDNFRNAMEDGYVRTDDWDDDDQTAPEPLRLHFQPIFLDPVEDWKELLPDYTATVERIVGWDDDDPTAPSPESLRIHLQPLLLDPVEDWKGLLPNYTPTVERIEREDPRLVYIPVLTWDAESFEEWTWPDPTLNGLLPEMGSTEDLWSVFGIEARQWNRSWDLDWTEGNWDWDLDEGEDEPTNPWEDE